MSDFLLEIGTEEIPARFIEPAKEGLLNLLKDNFVFSRISFGKVEMFATPRRISVFVKDVSEKQEESITIKYGPPYDRAFDAQGNSTNAATGFAKSQNVTVDELKKVQRDGIEFVAVERRETGRSTIEVLPDLLKNAISRIPFQKRMRWGNENFEFARPIQWLLILFGEEPVELTIADVKSGNITYGHRFLSKRPVQIRRPSEYVRRLRAHHVIVKEKERMEMILKGIRLIEDETHGEAIMDEDLIKEILYLTEYPYPLRGGFDDAFLTIPKEVLVNVMKSHQRYIPIQNKNNSLMPYFIFFANTHPIRDEEIIRGNEKVLKARLADAQFFFEEDKKVKLYDLYEKLSSIVFHVKLGTLKQKVERVKEVSQYLSSVLNYDGIKKIERAVRIMKVDLLTHMVGEFPELQGVMGRIYAKSQGEDDEVASAIEEHYLPGSGNGVLPKTTLGAITGIADKVDSLTSFFSVGITPTGNLDPFALRRQALGIIKIVIDKKFHIPLEQLIKTSYDGGHDIEGRLSFEDTKASLIEFIITRFKFSMIEENHNQEFVESVLPYVALDIYDGHMRLLSLETQRSIRDFERLMVGFKRVFNITKQLVEDHDVNPSLFKLKEEEALYNLYESKKESFFTLMNARKYDDALSVLVGFKETIDNFFDKVFVMDENEAIRNNRLALLKKIKDMFLRYGDFSKIRIE
jgi:glycyl-tRNA synthetase beta chain